MNKLTIPILMAASLAAISFTATAAQGTDKTESAFKAAFEKEMVDGDLKSAIAQYEKLARGGNRTVAAKALVRIGQCHEKMGSAEARKAYERAVRDFSDQTDAVAEARARLAAMGGASQNVRTRLLWDNATDIWGKASADGRHFSFTDWSSCDLGFRDLVTGETRKLTRYGDCIKAQGEVWGSAVSPDGKRVAYGYFRYGNRQSGVQQRKSHVEIRFVGADGTGDKALVNNDDLEYADPQSWSLDGKWVAATAKFGNGSAAEQAILIISTDSGQYRRLKVKRFATNVTLSPDGRWVGYSHSSDGVRPTLLVRAVTSEETEQTVQENARMMGWTPDGKNVLFSRDRGETHDLYLLPVSEGRAAAPQTQIYTSADVGARAAGVTRQGALLFLTSNSRSESLVLPWTGDGPALGTPLLTAAATADIPGLIRDGAAHFSNDGKRLLVVNPRNSITIRDIAGGEDRTVIPELKSWTQARWAHDGASLLLFGTDADGRKGVHRVDYATGSAVLLAELPNAMGFAPSRDGKTIYHGTPQKTLARDLATGQDKTLMEASGKGFYDLRVSRDGNRLAIRCWAYLAVVDLRSGKSREIYRVPPQTHTAIFAMDWSADDRHIVIIVRPGTGVDKMELWTFSSEGGEPVKRPHPAGHRGLSLSPDGKQVATTSLTSKNQVWALEYFLSEKNQR